MFDYHHLFIMADCLEDNKFYRLYSNPDHPHRYQENAMYLKFNPLLEEFQILLDFHQGVQEDLGQDHVKFYWPQDEGIYPELFTYLAQENFYLEKTLLMSREGYQGRSSLKLGQAIQPVQSKKLLSSFKDINLEADLDYGLDYAMAQQANYQNWLDQDDFTPYLFFQEALAVASLLLIPGPDFIEVDSLYVAEDFRLQGIATSFIQEVSQLYPGKTILLKVDAETSVPDFYQKLGFKELASQIAVQKKIQW